jgi:hypothetical protein
LRGWASWPFGFAETNKRYRRTKGGSLSGA